MVLLAEVYPEAYARMASLSQPSIQLQVMHALHRRFVHLLILIIHQRPALS